MGCAEEDLADAEAVRAELLALIAAGADVDAEGGDVGATVAAAAAEPVTEASGASGIVQAATAPPLFRLVRGRRSAGSARLFAALVEEGGADVNSVESASGDSPLIAASRENALDAVVVLLATRARGKEGGGGGGGGGGQRRRRRTRRRGAQRRRFAEEEDDDWGWAAWVGPSSLRSPGAPGSPGVTGSFGVPGVPGSPGAAPRRLAARLAERFEAQLAARKPQGGSGSGGGGGGERAADVAWRNRAGDTALVAAAQRGHALVVEQLLRRGGARRQRPARALLAAFYCAARPLGAGSVGCLFALAAEPALALDARDQFGETALTLACAHRMDRLALLLLRRGARADVMTASGETALSRCRREPARMPRALAELQRRERGGAARAAGALAAPAAAV